VNKKQNEKGFTLIELLIVISIICIFAFTIIGGITIIRGNFYWSSNSAFAQLQEENPAASKLLMSKTERNVWKYSKIAVMENGQPKTYCLDTNILFDHKFLNCP